MRREREKKKKREGGVLNRTTDLAKRTQVSRVKRKTGEEFGGFNEFGWLGSTQALARSTRSGRCSRVGEKRFRVEPAEKKNMDKCAQNGIPNANGPTRLG